MCLRELAIIDDTLEILGAPKEYQRLRNWIIRIMIGFIVYIFYELAYINIYVYFVYDIDLDVNFYFCQITIHMFLIAYPTYLIVLNTLISAIILGLVYV